MAAWPKTETAGPERSGEPFVLARVELGPGGLSVCRCLVRAVDAHVLVRRFWPNRAAAQLIERVVMPRIAAELAASQHASGKLSQHPRTREAAQ